MTAADRSRGSPGAGRGGSRATGRVGGRGGTLGGGASSARAHARTRLHVGIEPDAAVLTISVAAELSGMHAQTLRQYDRMGLVEPRRTAGRGRRYSLRDVARLREIQRLSQDEGINLAGIRHILQLRSEVERLGQEVEILRNRVESGHRVFTASPSGVVVAGPRGRRLRGEARGDRDSGALVLWQGHPLSF